MEDYNFWADLFDTYQSLPDWLKLAWLIALAAVALFATKRITGLLEALLFRWRAKPAQKTQQAAPAAVVAAVAAAPPPPQGLDPSGLFRVRTDEHGGMYLEPVGPTPMLDWDGSEKN